MRLAIYTGAQRPRKPQRRKSLSDLCGSAVNVFKLNVFKKRRPPMADRTALDVAGAVRQKYGAIATSVASRAPRQGCGGSSGQAAACCGAKGDPITSGLYLEAQTRDLPEDALAASLGCGNPTALLALEAGQTVLDLGSGGGLDVLLSAKPVGPTGQVYSLDL